jgi:hypothetical protein
MKTSPSSRRWLLRFASTAACLALLARPAPASAHADPVTPGVPYQLTGHTGSGARGTTYEVYANWDWILLTGDTGVNGSPMVFEQDGDAYRIKSTGYHWDGYDTWCAEGDGIKLAKASECRRSRWKLIPAQSGGWHIELAGTGAYVTNPIGGKQWLKVFSRFTFTPAG